LTIMNFEHKSKHMDKFEDKLQSTYITEFCRHGDIRPVA
jgi:hypothetical protein